MTEPKRAQTWLQGLSRRTLRDIEPIPFNEIEDLIHSLINSTPWIGHRKAPYRTNTEFYETRDRCLLALCFLTMGRIHEVLQLRKKQFDFKDPEFLVIHDFYVGKRKEKTVKQFGKTFIDIPISKQSRFLIFIRSHLLNVEDQLFKFDRSRAFQIIKYNTGLWCHWFRSIAQRFYVNKLENPMIVSDMFKVDIKTIQEYYRGSWMDHKDKLR